MTSEIQSTTLVSKLDKSVNYIAVLGDSYVESRFVQRQDDYIIVYLSSHNGCNLSCRFCHLTQSGQTGDKEVDMQGFIDQATRVLNQVNLLDPGIKKVHFNFMARGDALNSEWFLKNSSKLFDELEKLHPFESKFLISSIIPKNLQLVDFYRVFSDPRAKLYYSLYHIEPGFRKKWLPKAMDINKAVGMIVKIVQPEQLTIHYALLEGLNDTIPDTLEICKFLSDYNVKCKVNLIAYNPYSEGLGKSSDKAEEVASVFRVKLTPNVKIIRKVGFDVKASCGMFYEGDMN